MVALGTVFVAGALIGAGLSFAVPAGAFLDVDRQRAALLADTGGSLEAAAAFGDVDDPALSPMAALADALLVEGHGGGALELKRAERLLHTASASVRRTPAALYARVLLRRHGVDDPSIDDDIEAAAGESRVPSAWWLLAKALRVADGGNADDAFALVERAALGAGAPLHAQVVLSRFDVARGNAADALAVATRAERSAPDLVSARIAGVLAAVVDDARDDSPEKRAVKLKKIKSRNNARRDGPPRPGEVHRDDEAQSLATWHTSQEDEALDILERVDERDAPMLALFLESLAVARGDDELTGAMHKRVMRSAAARPPIAALQAELSLLAGDTAGADEILSAALDKAPGDRALLLDRARLDALTATWTDAEIKKRVAGAQRGAGADGLALPFGRLAYDPFAPMVPFTAAFDGAVFPEGAFAAALRGSDEKLAQRLALVVLLHKGTLALMRGDVPGASDAVARAREKAGGDPEVALLDARVRLRQGDRAAAKDAIESAVAAAPDDPHVLLVAARLHYDNEGFIPARKALARLKGLGFKSPAALALEAMLDARTGDAKGASAALAEAQNIGADDVEILRASVLLLRDGKDLDAVRTAASRLFAVDKLRSTDPILRAWEADAAARERDTLRAVEVLKEVIAARPNLADAYLLLGSIEAGTDTTAATADLSKAVALAPGSAVASEAVRRRAALAGPSPVTPRKKKGR